jgi:hypothetical protein
MTNPQLLISHGLIPDTIALVPRPTPLSTDFLGWLRTFARNTAFSTFDDETAEKYMEEVQEIVRPDCYWRDDQDEGGEGRAEGWELMYVRLRGSARMAD